MAFVEVAFKPPRREYFKNPHGVSVAPGVYCIVQAERGEDLGQVVGISDRSSAERKSKPREIVRLATDADVARLEENRVREKEVLEVCKERVDRHNLPMKLVDVEYQFDGNKITFFFTAEERIDFRNLVKDLAGTFRTRIELRQIGARDEARRFPGYGLCGRRLCCTTWLKEFEPVSLKMAKDQSLPLTPSKISGVCGRLMCCLSYELPIYRDLARDIPCVGEKVCCSGQVARVEKVDIFKEQVVLLKREKNTVVMSFEQIKRGLANNRTAMEGEGGGGDDRGEDDSYDTPKKP